MDMFRCALPAIACILVSHAALAQEPAKPADKKAAEKKAAEEKAKAEKAKAEKAKTFRLGEVTVAVTDKLEVLEQVNTRMEAEQIQTLNRDTVASALSLLPGVSFTTNVRNEQMVYVRGNDSRRVSIFLDGIPVYVPYDGNVDFARFTTFDLAEIQVAKGYSSVLYGPNTLGGAINLVTRRPGKAFEGDATLGLFEGQGRRTALNAGTLQDRWYVQAGASYSSADDFRLSSNFKPNVREDGSRRDNSDFTDKKGSFKVGFIPNATDEYVLGYVNQKGEKGNPVSTDLTQPARYWRWPTWNKESLYFTSNVALGAKSYARLRAYYDTYENSLFDYTDGTYRTINLNGSMKPTGKSLYDDFTHGGMLEAGTALIPRNNVRLVVQTKTDVHREDNGTSQWKAFQDEYSSIGLEDSVSVAEAWDLSLGLGWDRLKPINSAEYTKPATQSDTHGQAALFWKLSPDVQVYASAAQKNRFPTLKDRYTKKFGTFIENPDLKMERSKNYELGVKFKPAGWIEAEGALFRSDITDLIQEVKNVVGTKSQWQNIGQVRHSGVEVSVGLKPWEVFQMGLGYTYLDRDNLSNPTTRLTGTPRNRLVGHLRYQPIPTLSVIASVENQDSLWDSNTIRLGGFATSNLSVAWQPLTALTVDAGFRNILDRDYQLSSGFPLPGRTWFANARYRF